MHGVSESQEDKVSICHIASCSPVCPRHFPFPLKISLSKKKKETMTGRNEVTNTYFCFLLIGSCKLRAVKNIYC